MRRRIRQSGSALRKLINSLAAALVLNGKANAKQLFLRANPELAMARLRFWNRLNTAHEFIPVYPLAGKRVLDSLEP